LFLNKVRTSAALVLAAAVSVGALSACAPVTKEQGFAIADANPASAVIGTDTKQTVRTKFGTPTTMAVRDNNTWFYLSQTTDRFGAFDAQPRRRDLIEIRFDPTSERVAAVKTYNVGDGKQISYARRETPTIGRQLSIWDQILSTLGQSLLPPQQSSPGNAPGQPTPTP
jgi:outer membrane protein assembly factor BamE (lipoprotein component of BamABCDE complex)